MSSTLPALPAERPDDSVDPKMLEMLVCPLKRCCPATRCPLEYDREHQVLISPKAKLAYPIRDGIPIIVSDEARPWPPEPSP